MKVGRYFGHRAIALASLAILAASASSAALAGDVFWSVGVSFPDVSVPGVQVGASVPQQVYVPAQPYYGNQPVYAQPQVIYSQPQVIYAPPQVVYAQPQVIYTQPRPVYVHPQPVVVYRPPVYARPQPVYHNGWNHGQPRHGQYATPVPRRGHQAIYPQLPGAHLPGDNYSQRSDRG